MARDRQRAKQRKARREPTPPKRGDGDGIVPDERSLHRENVPGPVEHTGDVDEFEAALVAGAEGQEVPDPDAADSDATPSAAAEPVSLDKDDEPLDASAHELGDDDPVTGDREVVSAAPATRGSASPGENVSGSGGGRFLNFLRASWAELQRVQWPDRRQVGQATMVVLGFVLIAGAFLGFADYVAQKLVDFII